MHILILGGTLFLGRHIVDAALMVGHKVTTLNRGTRKDLNGIGVETLFADRNEDLAVLSGREFDAVIDTCAYTPDVISKSILALKQSVAAYLFVSTKSVYRDFLKIGITEDDDTGRPLQTTDADYGSLKAASEVVLLDQIPDGALIVRPGLIVGPYDPTDPFTYWPKRIAEGGKIIAPGVKSVTSNS